jgi:hypothetical protein
MLLFNAQYHLNLPMVDPENGIEGSDRDRRHVTFQL